MAEPSKPSSKKQKGSSRKKAKCAAYKAAHTSEKHKVKRVLQSNGPKAAKEYASKYGVVSYLNELLKNRKQDES